MTLVTRAVGSPTTGANGPASASAVSEDGRVVVFESPATDLLPGFQGDGVASQVFRWTPTLEPRGPSAAGQVPRVRAPGAVPGQR